MDTPGWETAGGTASRSRWVAAVLGVLAVVGGALVADGQDEVVADLVVQSVTEPADLEAEPSGRQRDWRGVRGAPPWTGAASPWRRLLPAPLTARFGHSAVWTGTQLIVWGGWGPAAGAADPGLDAVDASGPAAGAGDARGQGGPLRPLADGAAYDPATEQWRLLSPAPLEGRYYHTAVWTGTDMVILGGFGGRAGTATLRSAAAYHPATNSWSRIAEVPIDLNRGHVIAGGPGGIVVSGHVSNPHGLIGSMPVSGSTLAASWGPADGWEVVDAPPVTARTTALHAFEVDGSVIVIRDTATLSQPGWAARLDLRDGTWDVPPGAPDDDLSASRSGSCRSATPGCAQIGPIVWSGRELLLLGGDAGVAYEPGAGTWRALPGAPHGRAWSQPLWADGVVLDWAARLGYHPWTGSTRPLAGAQLAKRHSAAQAWTGAALIVWGGADAANQPFGDGAIYRPEFELP